MQITFFNAINLHNADYYLYLCIVIITIITINTKFLVMRRINDLSKIADLIKTNFKSSDSELVILSDGAIDVYAPYLPSNILTMVSSEVRIGVFPCGADRVLINIYKL